MPLMEDYTLTFFLLWDNVSCQQCVCACVGSTWSSWCSQTTSMIYCCTFREGKSKSGLFWSHTSSTLGPCSPATMIGWQASGWISRKTNIATGSATLYLSLTDWLQFHLGSCQIPSLNLSDTSPFLDAAMRTTMLAVVMVTLCVMMVDADVKPQKDFNLQRVRDHTSSHVCFSVVLRLNQSDLW